MPILDFTTFVTQNLGGLITGSIVAILQLVIVYLWIEKRVEKIQLKSEGRKWKDARKELDATLLALGQSLAHPLAYYTVHGTNGVHFRENYHACLEHVTDKSQSLDSILAIYSIGLAPESFSKITQLADRLRSTASNAKVATLNWARKADSLPPIDSSDVTILRGLKCATKSIEFKVPKDPTERAQKLFGYYVLQVLNGVSDISVELAEVAQIQFSLKEINATSRYNRLMDMSDKEQTAYSDHSNIQKNVSKLKALIRSIETDGLHLATIQEVD